MDKAKKKRIKKYITWISMALVVALLTAMPLLARQEAEADGPVASILSAEVTTGSIRTALHGGGTLSAENVEEVKLPSGVKIKEFLVKNGEIVTEGTPLAVVDKVSVMTAITEVSETLEYLREELEDARNETVSSSIKATAGGRVKKIFAEKGESVQDVMLRDGALAVLSLDGLMAVKLENDLALTTGETVALVMGEELLTGRVESNLDGVTIITVEDEGYEVGAPVTVKKQGITLGEGNLYIHNAWKATAYSGTIENVNAKEEKTVSSGATLFTLTDRDYEGELRRRANQHREYEELLQELFQMYESGILTAPCDGEVEGVDEDSVHLLSSVPDGWRPAPLNNTVSETGEKTWTVLLLSGGTSECTDDCQLTWDEHTENGKEPEKCPAICKHCKVNIVLESQHSPTCITRCTSADLSNPAACPLDESLEHYNTCIKHCKQSATLDGCGATKHYLNCIHSCTSRKKEGEVCPATATHKLDCIFSCTQNLDCPANDGVHRATCLTLCVPGEGCTALRHQDSCYWANVTYYAYASSVTSAGIDGLNVIKDEQTLYQVAITGSGWTLVSPNQLQKEPMTTKTKIPVGSAASALPGAIVLEITGYKGDKVVKSDVVIYKQGSASPYDKDALASMMGGLGKLDLSSMIGGFSGYGNYGAAAPEEEPLFDLEGSTLLTVTPHDSATLLIAVDEHDIAKISLGMKATVKVEALKGEEFDAEVTGIALAGTNNGGSSKFRVELTLPMTKDMLSGMSAAAIVPLEEKQDVLCIPAAALVQQGSKTIVYTALDEKTGEPASPVEVRTGLTDGENVEVISGLELGQKIYYSYYDTVELDTSAEAERYTLR